MKATPVADVFNPADEQPVKLQTSPAEVPTDGNALRKMQDSRGFATAIAVQQPRDLARIETNVKYEAAKLADRAFYGWGAGKNTIEGPSIKCANMLARCWGNCAIDALPVQELSDAWVFTAAFIDLETGFTLTRQFRQSKSWTVHGKHDDERKDDMRFQIGQSKAARNVTLNALPDWLITDAMGQAKAGVRASIQASIDSGGLEAAQKTALAWLKKYGILEDRVLAKFSRSATGGLTVDDLVTIRCDLVAIGDGVESAESLYPGGNDTPTSKADMRESLTKPTTEPPPPPEPPKATKDKNAAPTSPDQLASLRETVRENYKGLAMDNKGRFLKNFGLEVIDDIAKVDKGEDLVDMIAELKGM